MKLLSRSVLVGEILSWARNLRLRITNFNLYMTLLLFVHNGVRPQIWSVDGAIGWLPML